jgi:hypothetical protein
MANPVVNAGGDDCASNEDAYHKMQHKARDADEDISTWAMRNPFSLILDVPLLMEVKVSYWTLLLLGVKPTVLDQPSSI